MENHHPLDDPDVTKPADARYEFSDISNDDTLTTSNNPLMGTDAFLADHAPLYNSSLLAAVPTQSTGIRRVVFIEQMREMLEQQASEFHQATHKIAKGQSAEIALLREEVRSCHLLNKEQSAQMLQIQISIRDEFRASQLFKTSTPATSSMTKRHRLDRECERSPVGQWIDQPTPLQNTVVVRSSLQKREFRRSHPVPDAHITADADPFLFQGRSGSPSLRKPLPPSVDSAGMPSTSTKPPQLSSDDQLAQVRREKHLAFTRLVAAGDATKPTRKTPKRTGPAWKRDPKSGAIPHRQPASMEWDVPVSQPQQPKSPGFWPSDNPVKLSATIKPAADQTYASKTAALPSSSAPASSAALPANPDPVTVSAALPAKPAAASPAFQLPAYQARKNKTKTKQTVPMFTHAVQGHAAGQERPRRTDADRAGDLRTALKKVLRNDGVERGIGIFESHYHGINGADVKKNFEVVSVGGLCIVAAADALDTCPNVYPNYTKLVFDVWSNGFFHHAEEQDIVADGAERFLVACNRVFPNAELISFPPFQSVQLRRRQGSPNAIIRMLERASTSTGISVSIHGNIDTRGLQPHDWWDQTHIKRYISIPLLVNVIRQALGLPLQKKVQQIPVNTLRGGGGGSHFRHPHPNGPHS